MRTALLVLSAAAILGAAGFTVVLTLGQAQDLVLRLIACLLVLDHASLLLLHLFARVRVAALSRLLRITGPLVTVVGLGAVVESVRGGISLVAPYETLLGALLVALGGLSAVYLAREARGRPAQPEEEAG